MNVIKFGTTWGWLCADSTIKAQRESQPPVYVIWHQCSIIKHNQRVPSIDTTNWTLGLKSASPFLLVLPLCEAAHSLFGFSASSRHTVRWSSQISHTVGILLHAVFGLWSGHFCLEFACSPFACIGEKEPKLKYQPCLTTIDLIPIPSVLLIFASISLSFPTPLISQIGPLL